MSIFGQVIGAWIVPAILAGWMLSGMLGHVSRVALVPLTWQTMAGALVHGALVLFAAPRFLTSLSLSLTIGVVATCSVIVGVATFGDVSVSTLLTNVGRVYVILFVVAELSALLGWFLVRRELKSTDRG